MNEWISVDDRLPDCEDLVCIAIFCEDRREYDLARWNGDYWTRKAWPLGYSPTHWALLPEPPKQ